MRENTSRKVDPTPLSSHDNVYRSTKNGPRDPRGPSASSVSCASSNPIRVHWHSAEKLAESRCVRLVKAHMSTPGCPLREPSRSSRSSITRRSMVANRYGRFKLSSAQPCTECTSSRQQARAVQREEEDASRPARTRPDVRSDINGKVRRAYALHQPEWRSLRPT